VLLEVLGESFDSSVSFEVERSAFLSGRPELDGGESLNADRFDFVGSGVHLGDDEVGVVSEVLGELVVDGGELLAVTAPGGVELDEHVLGVVQDYGVEALADEDNDVSFLLLGDFLGFKAGSELSGFPVVDESEDVGLGDFAFHVVLLQVDSGVVDSDSG